MRITMMTENSWSPEEAEVNLLFKKKTSTKTMGRQITILLISMEIYNKKMDDNECCSKTANYYIYRFWHAFSITYCKDFFGFVLGD